MKIMNDRDREKETSYDMLFVSEEVFNKLQEFKQEMIKMESLQDSIISENNSVGNDWIGSASDADLGQIAKYGGIFDDIREHNKKRATALIQIIDRHKYQEQTSKDTVNDNVSSFDFTWQKKV